MKGLPTWGNAKPVSLKATAVANTNAVATIAAAADTWHKLLGIVFSYDADPSAAKPSLTIDVAGTEVFSNFVTAAGIGFIPIEVLGAIPVGVNEAVVVTLDAGGASVIGKLTVIYS